MESFLRSLEGMSVTSKIEALTNKLDQTLKELENFPEEGEFMHRTFAYELLRESVPRLIRARSTLAMEADVHFTDVERVNPYLNYIVSDNAIDAVMVGMYSCLCWSKDKYYREDGLERERPASTIDEEMT